MSLTSNESTPTLLNDYTFKTDLLTIMSDTAPETNDKLKHHAKAILQEVRSTMTSIYPYGVSTYRLLDAMIDGSEQAGLSTGVHYAAAAILVAYQKGEASNSSASELTKLAHDWFFFLLWPFKKTFRPSYSPQSEFSTPTPQSHASKVIVDTVPAASQNSHFLDLLTRREGDKCAVTGALNTFNAPHPRTHREAQLNGAHILPRSIVQEHPEGNRIAGTIDIIKHFTNLPLSIIDDMSRMIDDPSNGMLLEQTLRYASDCYMCCLDSTDVLDKYKIHWFRSIPSNLEDFTEVQFKDHSQTGIPPPNPMFIVLRSAISHILNLSGASEAIDKQGRVPS
ncbi:hypothetical protein EV424DRAFT_1643662 [Suillus variegatus]|nr:hypothetical protein EV424DRAFT_1643662 [Suillus variegatus]